MIINGFKDSCRKISSGVKKMADESMSKMKFHITPKEDLPRYSDIFRKLQPLDMDTKNVICYRLGTMLHLYIQKGKEAMKTLIFQKKKI